MNEELTDFLNRHDGACSGGIARLDSLGAETLEDAWEKASPADLVWAVTRPGVMSPEQRRQFLVFVLESIEDKLTDARSKNILEKLRTNSPITEAEAWSADAADAAAASSWAAAADAAAVAVADADADARARVARADADADAAAAAAWSAWSASLADADARAADAADAAAADASWEAAARAARAQADAAAREKQARWIRTNFRLEDLQTN